MSKAEKAPARVYKSQTEKVHDLYKLEVANAKKDISYDNSGQWDNIPHVHYFHSIDQSGNPQHSSTTIGGHFHTIEVVKPATDDAPAVLKCSGPLKWVLKKLKNGKFQKVLATASGTDENGQNIDNHTHDITYIQSQKLIPRKPNVEAAKAISSIQAKFDQRLPGVHG